MTQEQFDEKLDELIEEHRRRQNARANQVCYRNVVPSLMDTHPREVTGLREVEYAGHGYVQNTCHVCGTRVLDVTHACDGQPRFFCVTCKRPFVIDPPQRA